MRWRLLRAAAAGEANRALIDDTSGTSISIDAPGPVASLIPGTPLDVCEPTEVDDHDWWYVTTVDLEEPAMLRCEGLTPPGAIVIDGEVRSTVESMFLPVCCEIPAGRHEIALWSGSLSKALTRRRPRGRWRSTLVAAQGMRWMRTSLIGRAPVYGGVPPVVGPWRPVAVHDAAWIETLRVRTAATTGIVTVTGDLVSRVDDRVAGESGNVTVFDSAGVVVASAQLSLGSEHDFGDGHRRTAFTAAVTVEHPQRWWPHGYGEQPLYRLAITIAGATEERRIGFREVTVDRADGGFTLAINGIEVFCRGVVWSPVDPRSMAADREALTRHIGAFRDAGATMLRVMGGFAYEHTDFYDLCSEFGLLVWQDAMLTTFDPPIEQDDIVCAELAHLIDSISGQPALAVISGGSETQQQPEMLGVAREARSMPLIETSLRDLVRERADVPYVPSSPSSPDARPGQLAIQPDIGVAHWFCVGGYLRPLDDVKSARVRFAAESLAFAIPPSDEFVESHFGSLRVAGHDPAWKAAIPRDRMAAWDFEDVRDFYVAAIFGVDPMQVRRENPARYLQLGRLAVGEAMVSCYRFWRRDRGVCGGALVLFGRDLRPGAGWGLLDSGGHPKLPMAMLARVWAPLALTVSDDGLAGVRIDVHNDGPETVTGTLRLRAVDSGGTEVAAGCESVEVAAHGSATRYDSELTGAFGDLTHAYRFGAAPAAAIWVGFDTTDGRAVSDVLVVSAPGAPVFSGLDAGVTPGEQAGAATATWTLTVRARVTLRYVCVDVPGWIPSVNCFHLAAGIEQKLTLIRTSGSPAGTTTPRGRVSSIDATDVAVFAGDLPS